MQKPDQPVGLRNLGNTCYVNSVLQCLFANHAFRRAVYAARPPVAEVPAVKELRCAHAAPGRCAYATLLLLLLLLLLLIAVSVAPLWCLVTGRATAVTVHSVA